VRVSDHGHAANRGASDNDRVRCRSSQTSRCHDARAWRLDGLLLAVLSALGAGAAVVAATPAAAAVGIGSDRTKVAQLEQRLAGEGAKTQSLVARFDSVEAHMAAIEAKLASARRRLSDEHRAEAGARVRLRRVAVDAYVNAESGGSSTLAMLASPTNSSTLPEQQTYLAVASSSLDSAVTTFQLDAQRTAATKRALRSGKAETATTLTKLTISRTAAQAAIGADEAILSQVKGNLQALVVAANDRRQQAAERVAEQALAAAAAAASERRQQAAERATTQALAAAARQASSQTTTTTTAPSTTQPPLSTTQPPPTSPPAPGGYANPLRAITALTPERIDQGVDYSGFGPIYALGGGVVLSTVNSGWPGGTFISYRLTDGPASGLVVYAAEDIDPAVQVGEVVTTSTVLGQMYEGPSGIETGWADSSGDGTTMAAVDGQFTGSNSTAFGYNFSQLLSSLGASGGVLQNDPATGDPPPGWPQW